MADWYISSVAYAAIAAFQPSHVYSVGDLIKPSAPAFNASFVFRCTTAGTSGAEPTWTSSTPAQNNGTVTTGGVTFTNVTGQSAYGWGAAGGTVMTFSSNGGYGGTSYGRGVVGDRIFVSSDHNETYTGGSTLCYSFHGLSGFAFGQVQVISVNRTGSVPPVASDYLAGATISNVGSALNLDAICDVYWQGFKFIDAITTAGALQFGYYGRRNYYFKNCIFQLTSAASAPTIWFQTQGRIVFDNTVVQFANAAHQIMLNGSAPFEFVWINTPSAFQGTPPTTPFMNNGSYSALLVTCRGVDFSNVTGSLFTPQTLPFKLLMDSCLIAPAVVRFPTTSPSGSPSSQDEVELVNCWDGTNVINERWTQAGRTVSDRNTVFAGGAFDDVGPFSLKMIASSNADTLVMPVTCFQFDAENILLGSRTATVEILSTSGVLTNADIGVLLEYEGTVGSTLGSFIDSAPGALGIVTALPISAGIWNNMPAAALTTWNPSDKSAGVNLSNGNLFATSTAGTSQVGVRATNGLTSGKAYFEVSWSTPGAGFGAGICTATAPLVNNDSTYYFLVQQNGNIWINNTNVGNIGTIGANTICFAFDFGAQLGWARLNGGNWNGSGTANPATGVGGFSIAPALVGTGGFPVAVFNALSSVAIGNFGAAAFTQTIPSGFSAWNSFFSMNKQFLQVSFTPQVAGRVRALVRLMKAFATVWVNPQVKIT